MLTLQSQREEQETVPVLCLLQDFPLLSSVLTQPQDLSQNQGNCIRNWNSLYYSVCLFSF